MKSHVVVQALVLCVALPAFAQTVPPAPTISEQNASAGCDLLNRAERGDVEAQVEAGTMYTYGYGCAAGHDFAKAFAWYRKAAEQGSLGGQTQVGWMYEEGLGVRKDVTQAAFWYRKAAEQGGPAAQYRLGRMYEEGRGVTKDAAQAASWYRKLAEDYGLDDAMYRLALMYDEGRGVAKDPEQAISWYLKACKAGSTKASSYLRRIRNTDVMPSTPPAWRCGARPLSMLTEAVR
jgi:TPR repeat protein